MRIAFIIAAAVAALPTTSVACGCFSPPEPQSVEGEFAINQQAEQIIFEVDSAEETITAHVLIRYAGDPERFGWMVPVPAVPDLAITEAWPFGFLDERTAPVVSVRSTSVCPSQAWQCVSHPPPEGCGRAKGEDAGAGGGSFNQDAGFNGGGGSGGESGTNGPDPDDVQVHSREQVGDYDTVVLSGANADDVIAWLQGERFIVNDTMAPYMQPYLDAEMFFVASRLVAGADADSLKPLRMTFPGTHPMIPLQLTAVAAEPHLTVTAYIFGDTPYAPADQPLTEVAPDAIATGPDGRGNYPMALAAAVDEAGGRAFVREYVGAPPVPAFGQDSGCCGGGDDDWCDVAGNGRCECPGDRFDEGDCAELPGLLAGVETAQGLARHAFVTRITTRVSPEEMTFDPMFVPDADAEPLALRIVGETSDVERCRADVVDPDALARIDVARGCSATYCGAGACATTDTAAGCVCNRPTHLARAFSDLDGRPSVTCVPATPTVDFTAGGLELPDVCAGVDCGQGSCEALNGFAACGCFDGAVAVLDDAGAVRCEAIVDHFESPGTGDFTGPLAELDICTPPPPQCGRFSWLEPLPAVDIPGVVCASTTPTEVALTPPAKPTCADYGLRSPGDSGCGCDTSGRSPLLWSLLLIPLLLTRRRDRSPG